MWRRGGRVSWLSLKTKVDSLSVVWPQNHWDGFLQFGLNTGGDGFSRFGSRQDLATCFTQKQVGLGFSSLASRLVEARRRVVHVVPSRRSREDQVEDGRVDATGYIEPCYSCFAIFFVLGRWGILVF
jgi:hypothetical protein